MPENNQSPDVLSGLLQQTAGVSDVENSELTESDPTELLKAKFAGITPIKKLASGEVSATWLPQEAQGPLVDAMRENYPLLLDLGLGIYNSTHGVYVLFNPDLIDQEQLKAFDKAGNTLQALPPFDSFLQADPQASLAAPVTGAAPMPEVVPGMSPQATGETPAAPPVASPGGPQLSAGANANIAQQRVENASPKVPTERPRPGQGTVVNSLVGRAI